MSKASSGSIFRATNPSGKVVYKVEVPNGYTMNGRRKKIRRTAQTMAEARILQRKLIADIEGNRLAPAREETLQDYALWWLHTVKANHVRYSTATDYEDRLRRWVFPYMGRLKLSAIEARTVESWMAELAKKNYSTKTINGARTVLNGVLKHAYVTGQLSRNPVAATSPFRANRDEKTQVKQPWTKEEALQALDAAHGTDFDLFINIALTLGLRRGEMLGLTWDDINLTDGEISIRRTMKEERRFTASGRANVTLVTDKTKTRASERTLKIGLTVLSAIQRHKDNVSAWKQRAGTDWPETNWVFVSQNGKPLFPSNVNHRFVKFCRHKGLRLIRIHDMRHTAAILGLEANVRLEAVSQALGHTRIDVTKSIYAPYVQILADEFTTALDDSLNESLLRMHVLAEDSTEEVA